MRINKLLYIILPLLIGSSPIHAQKERAEICIDFRVNSTSIDATYMDNALRLDEILQQIKKLHSDPLRNITQVTFSGVASPEGNSQLNRKLAGGRLLALEKYIRSHMDLPNDLVIRHNDTYIPWKYLIAQIEASDMAQKEEVLSILRSPSELVPYHNHTTIDSRIPALQQVDNGKVWAELNKRFFPQMRNACFVLITLQEKERQTPLPETRSILADTTISMSIPTLEAPAASEPSKWTRQLHVKTNAIGLGLGIANLAVEVDICKHLSFTLPVYYSAWDYFKTTIKFRTLGIQPEVRYWFRPDNEGWFVGAHFGMAYYNIAWNGDYRYQDHDRETPAMGGGLAAGYRTHLSKNKKWKMEFSLGGGVYQLNYDKFHNTPVTKEGLIVASSIKKTYWGLDQASISIAYAFDLMKKGGKR